MAIEQAPVEITLREPSRRGRDFSVLLWLGGWGMATAVALSALAVTSQTQTAADRLRSILPVREPSAVAQIPPRVAQLELETQMLIEQIRALTADRDRLSGRIALLQSSVDDMTGIMKRQAAATAAALAARTASPSQPQPASTTALGAAAVAIAPASEPKTDAVTTASVALPSGRASSADTSVEPATPSTSPSQFGLELGSAPTLEGVQQRWITVKASFGPLLSGLHPLAAAERRGKTGYRLVVGPLPNGPAATGLCAHFNAAHTPCRAVKYEGEQIAQR